MVLYINIELYKKTEKLKYNKTVLIGYFESPQHNITVNHVIIIILYQ